ncbi:unnamed protein product, partial [Ixodes persulcatus]
AKQALGRKERARPRREQPLPRAASLSTRPAQAVRVGQARKVSFARRAIYTPRVNSEIGSRNLYAAAKSARWFNNSAARVPVPAVLRGRKRARLFAEDPYRDVRTSSGSPERRQTARPALLAERRTTPHTSSRFRFQQRRQRRRRQRGWKKRPTND